jgi:coenzyme F420-dependent glucose-6-phosphate dehydrogenase
MALEIHYNVFGCFREPRADIDLAADAVAAGFEGVWTGDHFMPWIDSRPYTHHVLPWLGTLLSEVPDVPVGTSVTCPTFRYRPPVLAQAVATIDNMYPGRFNLGVGVGEALNEAPFVDGAFPDWTEAADRLAEAIEVMRRLWNADEYVGYEGEHYQYRPTKLYTPPATEVPVHWAGYGPKSCRRAGEHADHLITAADPEHVADVVVPNFEAGLERAGRSLSDADLTTEFLANVGDPDDLVAEVRERGEYLPADTERDNPDPRDIQRVADERLAAMSDREVQEASTITDDPADLVAKLDALEAAGIDRVLVGSTCGDPRRTIAAFEEHVFPKF